MTSVAHPNHKRREDAVCIETIDPRTEKPTGEKIYLMVTADQFSGVRAEYADKGACSIAHKHVEGYEETYDIYEGEGKMQLDKESFEVKAGESVYIPPGVVHKITNIGAGKLGMAVNCAPPWNPDCKIDVPDYYDK